MTEETKEKVKVERVKGHYGIVQAMITGIATVVAAVIALYANVLHDANTTLQQENTSLMKQNEALTEETKNGNTEAEQVIASLEQRISDLEASNAALQNERNSLQSQFDAAQTEIESFKNRDNFTNQEDDDSVVTETELTGRDTPDEWVTNLDYFYVDGGYKYNAENTEKDNLGTEGYGHTIVMEWGHNSSIIYKVNGKYNRITGFLCQKYTARSSDFSTKFTIYADDAAVWSGSMQGGIEPVSFDCELNHAANLKIVCHSEIAEEGYHAFLADVGLWIS